MASQRFLGSEGFRWHQECHKLVSIPMETISNLQFSDHLGLQEDVRLSGQPDTQMINEDHQ